MWSEIFGTGLVETTEDFGVMGGRPSHPELLDWLALDFRENGLDVKRFYKQLVLSAAYRQSARVTPQLLEIDPKNRLLVRGPRYRMDGEMLRDTALATSGLLVEKIGGPSVKPYQPAGVWEAGSHQGSDTKPIRKTMARLCTDAAFTLFWKRMATMPDMDALDVPVRDATCTRRQRTDTPLQALVLMNDPQWLEASRRTGGTSDTSIARRRYAAQLSWRSAARSSLGSARKSVLENALTKFQSAYAQDKSWAEEVLKVGESSRDNGIRPGELASWMLVSQRGDESRCGGKQMSVRQNETEHSRRLRKLL